MHQRLASISTSPTNPQWQYKTRRLVGLHGGVANASNEARYEPWIFHSKIPCEKSCTHQLCAHLSVGAWLHEGVHHITLNVLVLIPWLRMISDIDMALSLKYLTAMANAVALLAPKRSVRYGQSAHGLVPKTVLYSLALATKSFPGRMRK